MVDSLKVLDPERPIREATANPVPPRFNTSVMQPVCIADPNPIRYQHAGD